MKSNKCKNLNEWAIIVKTRDNCTCQKCHKVLEFKKVIAHHIKERCGDITDLLPSNGITLCESCHKKVHNLMNTFKKTDEYIKEIKLDKNKQVLKIEEAANFMSVGYFDIINLINYGYISYIQIAKNIKLIPKLELIKIQTNVNTILNNINEIRNKNIELLIAKILEKE